MADISRRRQVLFDQDGAPDDLLSLLLLTQYDNVDLRGVAVTPADCLPRPALSATHKILDLVGREVPTAVGVQVWVYGNTVLVPRLEGLTKNWTLETTPTVVVALAVT